ncbi:MAG: tetratricopeptide repeat protein [Alphaproteobacteria bacterium]
MTLAAPQDPSQPAETHAFDAMVEGHVRAARAAFDVENYDGAIAACERLLAACPGSPEALMLLGLVSWKLDEPVSAVDLLRRAQAADPESREYADALATILAQLGDSTESLYYAKLATILTPHPLGAALLPPKFTEYFKNLNFARPHTFRNRARKAFDRGAMQEAVDLCSTQLELTPNEPETLRLIASALFEMGQVTSAVSALQTVIRDCATAHDYENLARFLGAAGKFDDAMLAHAMVIRRQPGDPAPEQARIRTLAKQYGVEDPVSPFATACRSWIDRFGCRDAKRPVAFSNPTEPDRRLRIGYIGAGLHAGDLAPMLEPVLARHDRNTIEIYVYADDARQDPMTESLMRHTARWTDLRRVDPETAAEIIRGDGIDIAVDLRGHGTDNRMLTFARRPAPVCLGWLGVRPASLDVHDAQLVGTDTVCKENIAAGTNAATTTDDGASALTLPADHPITMAGMPAVNPVPPLSTNGHITFGVLGPFSALGPDSVAIWKTALEAVPDAKLLVANHARMDSETLDRVYRLAAHVGLSERVTIAELEDPRAPRAKFMDYIDIVLDTMPQSGFTEVGEALWMGVPALAESGSAGARALTAAGKEAWVYSGPDGLRDTVQGLAGNVELLHEHRQNMRLSLADAPLFDVGRFTASLEAAYRAHWIRWCNAQAED